MMIVFIKALIANSNTLHSADGVIDIVTTSTDIHATVVNNGIATDISFNTDKAVVDFNTASRLVVELVSGFNANQP